LHPTQHNLYRDFFEELSKFGRLEALHICDNLGDHMVGHVYAKFSDEEEAADALNVMNGRFYDGRKMEVEFSPVTDFREARCRDFDEETCRRGGFCNFLHIKPVPMCLIRDMEEDAEEERRRDELDRMERKRKEKRRERRRRDKRRSRSRSRSRSDSRSASREREGGVK
jgi:splicing factor U2AF subunit